MKKIVLLMMACFSTAMMLISCGTGEEAAKPADTTAVKVDTPAPAPAVVDTTKTTDTAAGKPIVTPH
jgi:hypothetical protein